MEFVKKLAAILDESSTTPLYLLITRRVLLMIVAALFIFPPILLLIPTSLFILLFYILSKRFRNNSSFMKVITIIATFFYPICLFAIPIHRTVTTFFTLFVTNSSFFSQVIIQLLVVCFDDIPLLGIIIIFTFWIIVFCIKLKDTFTETFLVFIVLIHCVVSLLALLVFSILSFYSVILPAILNNYAEFLVDIVCFPVGSFFFFLSFTFLILLAWKYKRLNFIPTFIGIQIFFVSIILFVVVHTGSHLNDLLLGIVVYVIELVVAKFEIPKEIGEWCTLAAELLFNLTDLLGWAVGCLIFTLELWLQLYVFSRIEPPPPFGDDCGKKSLKFDAPEINADGEISKVEKDSKE